MRILLWCVLNDVCKGRWTAYRSNPDTCTVPQILHKRVVRRVQGALGTRPNAFMNEILSGAYSCNEGCPVEIEAKVEIERCLGVGDVELSSVFVGRIGVVDVG